MVDPSVPDRQARDGPRPPSALPPRACCPGSLSLGFLICKIKVLVVTTWVTTHIAFGLMPGTWDALFFQPLVLLFLGLDAGGFPLQSDCLSSHWASPQCFISWLKNPPQETMEMKLKKNLLLNAKNCVLLRNEETMFIFSSFSISSSLTSSELREGRKWRQDTTVYWTLWEILQGLSNIRLAFPNWT